jgi:dienelactone hydrolase
VVNFRVQRALLVALLAGLAVRVILPYVDAGAFIVRAAGLTDGLPGRLAAVRAAAVDVRDLAPVPTRHGAVPARLYRPARFSRTLLLVPGVHMDGIDETRLVGMAHDLAETGYAVVTVAPPDLTRFQVTPANTDVIEDAARWITARPDLAPDGRVGMVGISFSGGLSIVAAGRDGLRDRVAFVMSFGGHGDLARVMRYLTSGATPAVPADPGAGGRVSGAGTMQLKPPHDYGVTVVLLTFADHVVPAEQVEPLRQAILVYLTASSLTLIDMGRAEAEFARAKAIGETLPEPSRALMRQVTARAVDALGPRLFPIVDRLGDDADVVAMSPERTPAPAAPVFLLHGSEDTVIPPIETLLLAAHLRDRTPVTGLLSGLITHAEVDRSAALGDVWALTRFWRALMGAS